MITYDRLPNRDVAVYLDKKRVGTIIGVLNGYRYFPIREGGYGTPGDTFPTIPEVKKSLESTE